LSSRRENQTQNDQYADDRSAIATWLLIVYAAIGIMVVVGGVTRLTGSGLSMVTWRPLMGFIPPLGEEAWQAVFAQYKESPQYLQVNDWMKISDFKTIFFWEYLHRLWGRAIGLIFFLPWCWFIFKGVLRGHLVVRTFIAFILGGLQGALGWYMVKSGLVDVPSVSHYRLAAHLSLALFVGMYVLWLVLDLRPNSSQAVGKVSAPLLWSFLAVLILQILYGAFMAGSRAGYMYQTFPDMNGAFIPPGFFHMDPWLPNLVANHDAIHFLHRTLGWVLTLLGTILVMGAYANAETVRQKRSALVFGGLLAAQFILGVLTVVLQVPVLVGAAHQIGAYFLLSITIWYLHSTLKKNIKSAALQVSSP
jgi:heme a synthase